MFGTTYASIGCINFMVYESFTLHLHLADAFIQSDLGLAIQVIQFFVSTRVPWESNPQPLRY